MSTLNHLEQIPVNSALSSINESLGRINSEISTINDVYTTVDSAWSSENATKVKGYIMAIHEDLASLSKSVNNISAKVAQVVDNTIKSDTVIINGE